MFILWTHVMPPPRIAACRAGCRSPGHAGAILAPLSRRDMWILTRAARLMLEIMMKQFARDPSFSDESLDPTSWRFCRHPLDWLRVSSRAGPHWIHTHRAMDRAEQSTSDEDDCDEYPSEQDDRRSEY